jgi:hypothetical protein
LLNSIEALGDALMWTVVEWVSFLIIAYWLVKHAWPSRANPDARKREEERRHKELLEAIDDRRQRQNAPPSLPPPLPTCNSAERARVLALGRIRDGEKRHPILDTPYVSVANPQDKS